jgi:hypothetical protein
VLLLLLIYEFSELLHPLEHQMLQFEFFGLEVLDEGLKLTLVGPLALGFPWTEMKELNMKDFLLLYC